jgi:hypothetical protein
MSGGFFRNVNQQINVNIVLTDWRLTLSDEERKANISKHFKFLSTSYSNSQRFIASKKWEDDVYNKASSKDEYYQIIASKMQSFEHAQKKLQEQQMQLQQNQQTTAVVSLSTDWHLALSDEERKSNVKMLFWLFEVLNTNLNVNQRFIASKKLEDDAYNEANSKDEYNQTISAKMQLFKRAQQQQQQQQEQEQEQLQQLQQQQNQQTDVAASSWHLTLPDEERKENLTKLFMLFKVLDTKLNVNQRFIASKKWEDDAYNKASSKDEYNETLAAKMQNLKHTIQQQQLQQQQLQQKQLQEQLLRQSLQQQILQQQIQQTDTATSSLTDWHLTLSVEERKANVKKLYLLSELFNTNLNVNQRFIASTKWEDDAYKKANSKDEYNQIIAAKMQQRPNLQQSLLSQIQQQQQQQ